MPHYFASAVYFNADPILIKLGSRLINKMIDQLLRYEQRQQIRNKAKIYKEMLDSQVLMNSRLRKQRVAQSLRQSQKQPPQQRHIKAPLQKTGRHQYNSRQSSGRQPAQQEHSSFCLPKIYSNLDRNIRYHGKSRFIDVEDPQTPNVPQRRYHTQQVDSDTSFEGIIKEIQDISVRMPTNRGKKKSIDNKQQQRSQKHPIFFSSSDQDHQPSLQAHSFIESRAASYSDNASAVIYSSNGDKNVPSSRQNFVKVLKKIRNRGESLKIKLSKYPQISRMPSYNT